DPGRRARPCADTGGGRVAAVTPSPVGQPLPTGRRARWFLVDLHLALVAVAPVFTITGFEGDAGDPAIAVLLALGIGAREVRPRRAGGARRASARWAVDAPCVAHAGLPADGVVRHGLGAHAVLRDRLGGDA